MFWGGFEKQALTRKRILDGMYRGLAQRAGQSKTKAKSIVKRKLSAETGQFAQSGRQEVKPKIGRLKPRSNLAHRLLRIEAAGLSEASKTPKKAKAAWEKTVKHHKKMLKIKRDGY